MTCKIRNCTNPAADHRGYCTRHLALWLWWRGMPFRLTPADQIVAWFEKWAGGGA